MTQKRQPKGKPTGGQYAPSGRACEAATPALRLSELGSFPDETLSGWSHPLPVSLERYGDRWRVVPGLGATPFGLLASQTLPGPLGNEREIHHRALYAVLWGTVVAHMLNGRETTSEEATQIMGHMAEYLAEDCNMGDPQEWLGSQSHLLDSMTDDLTHTEPFLAIGYLETVQKVLEPAPPDASSSEIILLRELVEHRPSNFWSGVFDTAEECLRDCSGIRRATHPETYWGRVADRVRKAEAASVQAQQTRNEAQSSPGLPPTDRELLTNREQSLLITAPQSLAKLYDRYRQAGLPNDLLYEDILLPRVLLSKAADLRHDHDALTAWWRQERQFHAYFASSLDVSVFSDLLAHTLTPDPAERQDAVTAMTTIWEVGDDLATKRSLVRAMLFDSDDPKMSLKEFDRWLSVKALFHPNRAILKEFVAVARQLAPDHPTHKEGTHLWR